MAPYLAPNLGWAATSTAPAILGYQYDAFWDHSSQWSKGLEFGMFAKYSM